MMTTTTTPPPPTAIAATTATAQHVKVACNITYKLVAGGTGQKTMETMIRVTQLSNNCLTRERSGRRKVNCSHDLKRAMSLAREIGCLELPNTQHGHTKCQHQANSFQLVAKSQASNQRISAKWCKTSVSYGVKLLSAVFIMKDGFQHRGRAVNNIRKE